MKLFQRLIPATLTFSFFGGIGLLLSAVILHFYNAYDAVSVILACLGVALNMVGILLVFTAAGLSHRMD